MDLDSDTYYSGAAHNTTTTKGGGGGAGGHSFTSYSTTRQRDRDRLFYDKYGGFDTTTSRYSSSGPIGGDAANNSNKHFDTTTSSGSGLYRPSMFNSIGGSGAIGETSLLNHHHPTGNKNTTSSSSAINNITSSQAPLSYSFSTTTAHNHNHNHNSNDSSAIDKLISSSSAAAAAAANLRDHHHHPSLFTTTTTTATATATTGVDSYSYGGGNSNHHLPAAAAAATTTTTTTAGAGVTTSSTAAAAVAAAGGGGSSSRVQSSLGQQHLLQQLFDDMRQIEDTVDSIEIPARGRCKVFMAKYGYDPFKQSPNDNPDAELAFNAGDYIMVFDDIDEDGYFIGELMDGRRGYVPSNWLDRLTGEDLFEFQAKTLYKQTKDDENESNSCYPPEFYDAIVSETMNHSNFQHLLAPEDYHRMNDYVDLDDVNEVDDECLSDYERAEAEQMRRAVPPPQRLILERQLNKSILIGWLHPQAAKGTIVSYQVYVDGVLKSTVPSGDRTKALLEGVDSIIPHRISVRAIDLSGRHSNDAGCTIVIGQKIPFAPSCVKASHITSDSALISWLPCNSNFHHVVAVNSVEVQTLRPGVYKHLINGLSANTLYRVWVRAKPGKILSIDEKNPKKLESLTTYVDFKTMPKSLPDPPVNVQVEAGPQRRTLLVTWLPLTLNDFGSSNGCAVTGYAVFAGHKKLADIDSPTGDHALLDLTDLESLHKKSVTVRTKSGENLSQDSMPCQIPDEYLKSATINNSNFQQQQMIGGGGGIRHVGGSGIHHHHPHHHQQQQQQQRLSDSGVAIGSSGGGRHSPMMRHSSSNHHRYNVASQQQQTRNGGGGANRQYSIMRGRQFARSLQNLESDLDSRRSSIPAIEITRETSGSDIINPTESYSEEEFENSMRFRGIRGGGGGGKQQGGRMNQAANRYRARQSHSVDSSVPHRQYQSTTNIGPKMRATPIDSRDIRYFVALFDYDPSTMSPNPNAASEELAFKEGSIIKVIGDKGPDGFYRGELDNHVGYVPCNVVSEITDSNLLYSLQEKNRHLGLQPSGVGVGVGGAQVQQTIGGPVNYLVSQQRSTAGNQQQQVANQQHLETTTAQLQQQQQQVASGVKRMTALYDYDPQESSPNADTESEIPFKVGDVIYVYGKMDTDGFYMGEVERTKQRGLVPSNFLREDPLPQQVKQQQQVANLMQQQPTFNQMGVSGSGGQMMSTNVMDQFQQQQQQQRQPNANQFIGGGAVQQQPDQQQSNMVYGGQQQQQQQQVGNQQQINKQINNPNQMRGNQIRGILPSQNQRTTVDQMLPNSQQNINRPTTLSLGLNSNQQQTMAGVGQQSTIQNDWSNNAAVRQQQQQLKMNTTNQQLQLQQQLQQQQQQQNRTLDGSNPLGGLGINQQQQFGGNLLQQQNQQQPLLMSQQPNMLMNSGNLQQQQQQQQTGGGVLSNLLSSGKQIIGAATTPRLPNQPQIGQFPSMNQMGNLGIGAGGLMGDQTALGGMGNFSAAARNTGISNLIQQQQPVNAFNVNDPMQQQHNSFLGAAGVTGGNQMQQPGMQQLHQVQQHPGVGLGMQQQQQQQQHYNQMGGLNRAGGAPLNHGSGIGEEQGGNILNTVKNMFKL